MIVIGYVVVVEIVGRVVVWCGFCVEDVLGDVGVV